MGYKIVEITIRSMTSIFRCCYLLKGVEKRQGEIRKRDKNKKGSNKPIHFSTYVCLISLQNDKTHGLSSVMTKEDTGVSDWITAGQLVTVIYYGARGLPTTYYKENRKFATLNSSF